MKKAICLFYLLTATIFNTFAQDSVITELAKKHVKAFNFAANASFSGEGWNDILNKAQKSNYVLIGEDHLMNEVPKFCHALLGSVKFDNLFCETDPFSAKIIESKIKGLPEAELKGYVSDYGNTFSFFAMKPELDLLKLAVKSNTKIFGTDQILLVADRLICSEWKQKTTNKAAAAIYTDIENQSKTHFDTFRKDPQQPFYMLTPAFEKNLDALEALKLSKEEVEIISKLRLTARIYKEQSHHLRVQLMKEQLMTEYDQWADKKSMFKYGSNHLPKGESLMDIYDIGNLVNNIADSKFQNSLHLMIIAKSGFQASPFEGFPASAIDPEGEDLKVLKPFFKIDQGESWQCFDLAGLRADLKKAKIQLTNHKLTQIVEGYDLLVIIPKGTPSGFAFKE